MLQLSKFSPVCRIQIVLIITAGIVLSCYYLHACCAPLFLKESAIVATQWVQEALQSIRGQLCQYLRERLPHMSSQAILPALLLGDREYLLYHHWQVFAATGTSHLLAISGLHVGMVWGSSYWLMRRLIGEQGRVAQSRWPVLSALGVAAFYAMLTGFSLPTQRALLMLTIISGMNLTLRVHRPLRGWFLALLVVLFLEPIVVKGISFWLSFTAVALLILSAQSIPKPSTVVAKGVVWIRLQLILSFGLAPWVGSAFGKLSWVSPLVNILVVPGVTLLLLPGLLLAMICDGLLIVPMSLLMEFFSTSEWSQDLKLLLNWCRVITDTIFALASLIMDLSWHWLDALAGNHSIVLRVPPMSLMQTVGLLALPCCMVTAFLMLPRSLPGRWLLASGSIPLLLTLFGLSFKGG